MLKRFEQYRNEVEKFSAFADFCPIPAFITAHDGLSILYVNPAYVELTGCEVGMLNDGQWTQVIHADDRQRAINVWKQFIVDRKPVCISERFVNVKSGQVFDTICTVHAIPGTGMVGYVFPKGWLPAITI